MACAFGLPELASHNPFLKDLLDTGYHVDFVGGYLVIYGLPYLDQDGELQHGDWMSKPDLNGLIIDPPSNHQAWWRGTRPHSQAKLPLKLGGGADRVTIEQGLVSDCSFSFKLLDEAGEKRNYTSFDEKVQTYLTAITGPAIAAFPDKATPLRGIEIKAAQQGTPLRFPDTMSSSYNINDISFLLRGKKVAIIGLGGTGSYVLDFVARTHLERIALFDDDKVHVHTIFRIPGFIPGAIGSLKVDALNKHYSQWHKGIEAFPERITKENIERLSAFDFVFVSVDDGPSRDTIVDWLSAKGIPYVDCGMGLTRSLVGLTGFVRITGTDRAAYEKHRGSGQLPIENAKEDEYRKQAQITEFNALNAAFAVIRFKQHFLMLDRVNDATSYIFDAAEICIDKYGSAT